MKKNQSSVLIIIGVIWIIVSICWLVLSNNYFAGTISLVVGVLEFGLAFIMKKKGK